MLEFVKEPEKGKIGEPDARRPEKRYRGPGTEPGLPRTTNHTEDLRRTQTIHEKKVEKVWKPFPGTSHNFPSQHGGWEKRKRQRFGSLNKGRLLFVHICPEPVRVGGDSVQQPSLATPHCLSPGIYIDNFRHRSPDR